MRFGRRAGTALLLTMDWTCAMAAAWLAVPVQDDWPVLVAVPVAWVGAAGAHRLYERRHVGPGTEEYHRILRACLAAMAALAALCALVARNDRLVRGVLLAVPAAAVGSLVARKALRALQARNPGWATRSALLVGSSIQCSAMAEVLRRERSALRAVAALEVAGPGQAPLPTQGMPGAAGTAGTATAANSVNSVNSTTTATGAAGAQEAAAPPTPPPNPLDPLIIGTLTAHGGPGDAEQVATALQVTGCEVVVLMPGPHLGAAALSGLGWRLASVGVDILVAPFLSEIAPARLAVRRDGGVPLFHIRSPRVSRGARVPKELGERVMAALGLVLLAPIFLAVSLAILLGDGRPIYFRQVRVGLRGEHFVLYKFRTMATNAAAAKPELAHLNVNADGLLFKARRDPRVTKVGAVLRRYSLDELPQLLNVVRGDMALVGPRPPLPEEAAKYSEEVRRRLLVKPGLTGLWQVSGRSDLAWADAVRLDLGYVENWSLGLDAEILLRTGSAVVKGKGAY
ncbi:sugar transferase [Catenulispora sp. NL8]|uniref:Sugar transferase n=2 Tax=Catenulispora pinistramenti TaxID=2705254 RepID=A0ABS5KVU4_9ACTN|nr:sugar transferase [Catenulispora pinistramenti]